VVFHITDISQGENGIRPNEQSSEKLTIMLLNLVDIIPLLVVRVNDFDIFFEKTCSETYLFAANNILIILS